MLFLLYAGVSSGEPPPATTAPSQVGFDDDAEFDMFAQTRQMVYPVHR